MDIIKVKKNLFLYLYLLYAGFARKLIINSF